MFKHRFYMLIAFSVIWLVSLFNGISTFCRLFNAKALMSVIWDYFYLIWVWTGPYKLLSAGEPVVYEQLGKWHFNRELNTVKLFLE